VHDAITEAPPGDVADAVPLTVLPETAPAVTETDVGSDEVHVRGTPVIMFPRLSLTVVEIISDDPSVTIIGLPLFPFTEREMD
jgi:hypothetical protein